MTPQQTPAPDYIQDCLPAEAVCRRVHALYIRGPRRTAAYLAEIVLAWSHATPPGQLRALILPQVASAIALPITAWRKLVIPDPRLPREADTYKILRAARSTDGCVRLDIALANTDTRDAALASRINGIQPRRRTPPYPPRSRRHACTIV